MATALGKVGPMGRRPMFDILIEPYLDKIAQWIEAGASQTEIADKLGIAASTYRKYLALGNRGDEPYTKLTALVDAARKVPDDHVEAAMYKRACGIQWSEETYENKWDEDRQEYVEVLVKRVTKYTPPDPTSMMFWLANRRPDRWKYRPGERETAAESEGGVIMMPEVQSEEAPEK